MNVTYKIIYQNKDNKNKYVINVAHVEPPLSVKGEVILEQNKITSAGIMLFMDIERNLGAFDVWIEHQNKKTFITSLKAEQIFLHSLVRK